METDSPIVYHGTSESRFPPEQIQRAPVSLTPEEIRILRECNKESFYYRCLPFALAGIAVTYYGVKKGVLSSHPRYGPAGKLTAAAFAGWLVGKASYRSRCEDKFLHLENSAIGRAVRKKRGYVLEKSESESDPFLKDEGITLKDNYTSYSGEYHSSAINFDKNILYSELDDTERPSLDRETAMSSEQSQPLKPLITYDELRRKNREEYDRQYRQPEASRLRSWGPISSEPQRKVNLDSSQESVPKNAYGDSWDNPKFT